MKCIFSSAVGLRFSGLFVCNIKTTEWVSAKLGARTGSGPRKNPLHFGVAPDTK